PVQGHHAGGVHGRGDVPAHRGSPVPADLAGARILLVPASRTAAGTRGLTGEGADGPDAMTAAEVRYADLRAGESAMAGQMPIMTFEEILAAWLPGQRRFAGKGTPITGLARAAQPPLVPP